MYFGWTIEIPDLHKWVITAQPNESTKYFIGLNLSESILSRKVGWLTYFYSRKGLIYLVRKRNDSDSRCFDYIMIRASKNPHRGPKFNLVPVDDGTVSDGEESEYGQETRNSKAQREPASSGV